MTAEKSDKRTPHNRFQQVCPRRLKDLPDAPCPLALARIEAIQANRDKKTRDVDSLKGCSWYCTSADANYCFFSQIANDPGPYTDEDISALLSMSNSQIAKSQDSGMTKLKAKRDTPEMQELKEMLVDVSNRHSDNTVYLPDSYLVDKGPNLSETHDDDPGADDSGDTADSGPKPKRQKVHLYGLYSDAALKRLKKERDAQGRPKKTDQEK